MVSPEQLNQLGFTPGEIQGHVRMGEFVPLHRGVLMVGRASVSARGRCWGALLAMGESSFLSHRTAAGLYGLRALNGREIEITTPGRPRARKGLVVHRTTNLDRRDVRTYRGLRVSTVSRMLIELATREPDEELTRLLTVAVQKGLFDVRQTRAALARHERRPGIVKTRQALAAYVHLPRDKSTLERDFAAWLATDPTIPPPQRNVYMGPYEFDFHWADLGFVAELDGRPWHIAVEQTDRDHAKDIWCQLNGLNHMRITDFRFTYDKPGIHHDLHAFLALGRQRAAA